MNRDLYYEIISYFETLRYREVCKLWRDAPIPIPFIRKIPNPFSLRPIKINSPFIISFVNLLPEDTKECMLFSLDKPEIYPLSSFHLIRENFKVKLPSKYISFFNLMYWCFSSNYLRVIDPGTRLRFVTWLFGCICDEITTVREEDGTVSDKMKARREKVKTTINRVLAFVKEILEYSPHIIYQCYNNVFYPRGSVSQNVVNLYIDQEFPSFNYFIFSNCLPYLNMNYRDFKKNVTKGLEGNKIMLEKYIDIGFPSDQCHILDYDSWKGEPESDVHSYFYYLFRYLKKFSIEIDVNDFVKCFSKHLRSYKDKEDIPEDIRKRIR